MKIFYNTMFSSLRQGGGRFVFAVDSMVDNNDDIDTNIITTKNQIEDAKKYVEKGGKPCCPQTLQLVKAHISKFEAYLAELNAEKEKAE